MAIEKGKCGLILLGSQSFPTVPGKDSVAFFNSYKKIRGYFTQEGGLELKDVDILDLFDSEEYFPKQNKAIARFISDIKTRGVEDLFVYYTGHGAFASDGRFLLMIKTADEVTLNTSCIAFPDLAQTLRNHPKLRIFIILDCCYAAEARKGFQSGDDSHLHAAAKEHLPAQGVALYASSAADLPSFIAMERDITVFTEALSKALDEGDPTFEELLTLHDLQDITFTKIKNLNLDKSPPLPHVYDVSDDSIARRPHFRNSARRVKKTEPYLRKPRREEIEKLAVEEKYVNASELLMTYRKDFDTQNRVKPGDVYDLNTKALEYQENKQQVDNIRNSTTLDERTRYDLLKTELPPVQALRKEVRAKFYEILDQIDSSPNQ